MVAAASTSVRAPLIGRDHELARLQALVAQAREGHGRLVFVSGEPGIGKTRLVRELRQALGSAAWVLTGTAYPGDASVAFGPLAESLRNARRPHLAFWEAAEAHSGVLSAIVPELRGEAGLGRASVPGDLPVLFEALLEAVDEASEDGPCVWVLEDLHWADPSTWAFVKHAARRLGQFPVVLIATFREEEVGLVHGWWQRLIAAGSSEVEALRLERLTDGEASALVTMLSPKLSEQAVRDVVARSAGTPLIVEELLALTRSSGARLPPVPQIVQLTFQDRARRLSPSGRDLLDIVAVAGRDAADDLLLALELPDLDATLEECRSVGLLTRGDEGAVSFRHPMLLEAAYASVAPARRMGLHGQIGDVLAGGGPDVAERVARHLEGAGRPAEALEALEAVANLARREGNVGRAASLARAMLELVRRQPGLRTREEEIERVAIAEVFRAGRWTDLDPLIHARWRQRRLLGTPERAWLAGIFVLHLFWTGSVEEADATGMDEVLHLEQTGERDAGAMLLAQVAFIAWFRGDAERARRLAARSLEIARSTANTEAECRARNAMASASFLLGRDRTLAAERHWENAGFARANRLSVAEANALWSASHFTATIEAYEAAEWAAELAGTWYAAPARVWKGMLHLIEGRPDLAEEIFQQVGPQIRQGVPAMAPWMDTVDAWLLLHRGQLEEAQRILLPPARPETADLAVWADQRSAAEGWLAWEDGLWRESADKFTLAEEQCSRGGYHLTVGGPILLPLHVDALLRLRRRTEAESVLESARHAHPSPDRFFDPAVSAARFRLHPSEPLAAAARLAARKAPWPWLGALVSCWEGELLRDRHAVRAGRRCFEQLGAAAGVRRADAILAVLGGASRTAAVASGGLSAREIEVAELVASGLTNPAIGRRLHLSRPTVASHVSHILTKLGFTSRSQVAAWFTDQQAARADDKSST